MLDFCRYLGSGRGRKLITELKQRRRRRQRERLKTIRFRLAKQQPCACITFFFLYISLPSLYDYDVKLPILREHKTPIFFFLLWTQIEPFRIQLPKKIAIIWQIKGVGIRAMKSLKQREFTFWVTVSPPLPSSLLKLPSYRTATNNRV